MNQTVSRITQKRLIGELKLLKKEPLELIDTYPDEKNSLIWYFMVRGVKNSDYDGGFYIGKILHNPEYPLKPPDFVMLTPNGRFMTEKKICLTNTGYHSENWSAIWNIRLLLIGFLSIMADDSTEGISHIKDTPKNRKKMAINSIEYNKKYYYENWIKFERFINDDGTIKSEEEIKLLSKPKKRKKKKNKN
jgi:ubiquitin-conjugating enzyme E2 J2